MVRSGSNGSTGRDLAVSEVIGFILLLAVIVTAFSLWMIYVVPANGREAEISHMNEVKDRFTDYKISIDSLWINNESSVTLSTSFNLGTGGGNTQAGGLFLPLTSPIASSATMSVKDYGDRMFINTSTKPIGYIVNLTALEYQSQNNYWLQQTYYYQEGGVFLSQVNGSTYRVSPPITLQNISAGGPPYARVTMQTIQLLGTGTSIGGDGPVRVDTMMRTPYNLVQSQPNSYVNISVNVSGQYATQMWLGMFSDMITRGEVPTTGSSWFTTGSTFNAATNRGYAFINMTGPSAASNSILFTLGSSDYVVTLNNIAQSIS